MSRDYVMNTGKTQELALFKTIKRELRKKRFGLLPECCAVYHQRAYFSPDRNAEIVFDIAIEVSLPGAATPFLIWIWESKDYSSPLSVDNVEEFHAKLQQVGADKTKGTIVLSGEIQKAALAFAKSKGIGVAKFLPGDRIEFWQFSKYSLPPEVEKARFAEKTLRSMTDPQFISINRGFYAYAADGHPFDGGFEQYLQNGFIELLNHDIWRNDLEGWHWRNPFKLP
jgi:hypothetical protein